MSDFLNCLWLNILCECKQAKEGNKALWGLAWALLQVRVFSLSIWSDFQNHSNISQCWTGGFESKRDIKYGYRHELKWNVTKKHSQNIFFLTEIASRSWMPVTGSIYFLMVRLNWTGVTPPLAELSCFQVLCSPCSSGCRAGAGAGAHFTQASDSFQGFNRCRRKNMLKILILLVGATAISAYKTKKV